MVNVWESAGVPNSQNQLKGGQNLNTPLTIP